MSARHRRCPTPDKKPYPSYWAAVTALRSMSTKRGEVRAYKCRKHWHLSSRPR